MRLEQKSADENIQVTFPYANEASGATVVSAVVTVTVLEGTDASPSSIKNGAPFYVGTEARQLVHNGVTGVKYRIHCLALMTDGRYLAREYGLEVVPT